MQPRREFNEEHLKQLSDSIRQYGVLQPMIVIRHEKDIPTGTVVEYELIAGERRWRASKMAGLMQVPVIIREDPSEQVKLELALIENLQREDLGPIERAEAFAQLIDNFKMRHHEVGAKMGKSRVFVSNSLRLLGLPDEIKDGLRQGLINEGHTRPLLSLKKQKDEQMNLYKDIVMTKMTVRDAEKMAREIVQSYKTPRVKPLQVDPEAEALQQKLSNVLGTKVSVQKKGPAKKISFEFDSEDQFAAFLAKVGAMNEAVACSEKEEEPCETCSHEEPESISNSNPEIRLASCTTCTPESSPSLQEEAEEIIKTVEFNEDTTPKAEPVIPEDPAEEPKRELEFEQIVADTEKENDKHDDGLNSGPIKSTPEPEDMKKEEKEDDEETDFFSMF